MDTLQLFKVLSSRDQLPVKETVIMAYGQAARYVHELRKAE